MPRITPRTCLWPITFTLLGTFALSIGLTYRSDHYCYAGTCGESLFPLQARLHVVVWYSWIALSVTVLSVRAFHPRLREALRYRVLRPKVPFLDKHLAVSGLLILAWIVALYGIIVGIWWLELSGYFIARGRSAGVDGGNRRLAAIALTGHMCDVTMGMVLLPISRHSALASFFKLSVSTTLTFHMLAAYTLFALVITHGLLYASWIPAWTALSEAMRRVYPLLNPTYRYGEAWPGNTSSLGIWRASLVFTGLFTAVIMILIFITTIPKIRREHFNLFYFTHLLIILGVIVICLHASTMFYCTAPGLVLWVVDWAMRLLELRQSVPGSVTTVGNGYFVLTMPMPRRRLIGCACTSPLAHFYIYHSQSSVRELHPFTTITHLASENFKAPEGQEDIMIQFLFRARTRAVKTRKPSLEAKGGFFEALRTLIAPKAKHKSEWTEKLAGLVDTSGKDVLTTSSSSTDFERKPSVVSLGPDYAHPFTDVSLRLEGPYFTPADPSRYETVVCLVAGTGISGAIAVAEAFREIENQRASDSALCGPAGGSCMASAVGSKWRRCIVVWSVREADYAPLPFLRDRLGSALEVRVQLTGPDRPRLDFGKTLVDIKAAAVGTTWVYLSGPTPFIKAGEVACEAAGVDCYGARWDI